MTLLDHGRPTDDRFVAIADDAPLPADAPALIPFARLQRDADALAGRNAELGVQVPSTTHAEELAPFLGRVSLVVVEFPKFRDGRGFSIARTLRERYGFAGEIRAVGHILPDQYLVSDALRFFRASWWRGRRIIGVWTAALGSVPCGLPSRGGRAAGPSLGCAGGWRWAEAPPVPADRGALRRPPYRRTAFQRQPPRPVSRQQSPQRPRRARAFRHVRRALRRRDADAAHPRGRAGL